MDLMSDYKKQQPPLSGIYKQDKGDFAETLIPCVFSPYNAI